MLLLFGAWNYRLIDLSVYVKSIAARAIENLLKLPYLSEQKPV